MTQDNSTGMAGSRRTGLSPMGLGERCFGGKLLAAGSLLAGLAGCINVTAPAEPIVIELNINIRQEVIYRLAEDAGNTIEENPGIF